MAEGAKVIGKIYSANQAGWVAYDNCGTLTWTKVGQALDLSKLDPVSYDAETNTLTGNGWFYNDANGNAVPTSVIVADVYDYFLADVDAEAVNPTTLVFGDLATVIGAATAGQTVEILKDVRGVHSITISKAITIDGNGHTLTMYIAEDPEAEANKNFFMMKNTVSGVVYKNIIFHGGAAEKAVWDGALAPYDAIMLPHAAKVTFDGCTITGARFQYTTGADTGYLFGYSGSDLIFNDCTITDNFVKVSGATYNTGPHITRGASNAASIQFNGCMVFKDNFAVTTDGKTYRRDYNSNALNRSTIGQLTEGSEFYFFWSSSYNAKLDPATGKPYNNAGYIFGTSPSTAIADPANPGSTALNKVNYLVYTGQKTSNNVVCHEVTIATAASFGETVNTQGGITSDKFALSYMPTVTADYYNTDVVVTVGEKEILRKSLSEYTPATSVITIDGVAVGMAELTDDIVITLQKKGTTEVLATYTTTAKAYADALIALTSYGDYTAEKLLSMKNAVAGLLQYGAMVQAHFDYNTDKPAMTAADVANWKAQGLTIKSVADSELSAVNATVQATSSGTLPAGVALVGATLTMENEMSLRIYFTATNIDGLTFTIGGEAATAVKAGGTTYYLEASNIGTGKLATAVVFTISDGNNTFTYNASPMSYVYAVHTKDHASITASLKDACEALYYYYEAVAAHFGITDGTGFGSGMVQVLDVANSYSVPYGIV